MFETGQIEHLLAAIDNIVNSEVNLPPGEQTKLFQRIRQVGKGYTVIGTNYSYNARNQLVHRENQIRYEDYDYSYDEAGNLLTDGRSKYEWNALGQLTKVTFPDGFGEKYTYDMLGRRISKTDFNHTGETQEVTSYTYKGDTWAITEERDGSGQVTKSYTYDANDRPLTITMEGQTFWYVYNGHGDVTALTDKNGKVAARYEYDAWGLVNRMYNGLGERVREGIGWIGDLGTGNGSPGSVQGPEDKTGNIEPDYHPGNGNNNGNGKGAAKKDKAVQEATSAQGVTEATDSEQIDAAVTDPVSVDLSAELSTVETEPTDDITTDLVKENPYRYAGYYWDRKTQYYYLQARYYDPRPARFISEDTYEGEINNPLSLNLYTYVSNNPLGFTDISGHKQCEGAINCNGDRSGSVKDEDSIDISKLTLGAVRTLYSERFKFDSAAKGFHLAQQYYIVWYYGTEAYDRLDEATLSHNSYLVYKLDDLRKDRKDLSKLKVAEVDKMSFNIARNWCKIDTAAVSLYGISSAYGYTNGKGKFKGVEVVAPRNQLTELDEIDLNSKTIFEDKNASGLYMSNPNVPQTEQQWAKKQIYNKTVNRIDTIQNAVSTRPTTNGSKSVPSISDIQKIKKYVFRINADTPALRKAVQNEIKQLKIKYPSYNFSARFGGQ